MYTITLNELVIGGYDLGLQSYEIFNENYRIQLNKKIINRYSFNEIAFETPARFIFELNTKMSLIMPYYNAIIQAQLKLNNIGYDELLKLSIGFDNEVISERITDNTTNQKTDNIDNSTSNTNSNSTTTYNSDDKTVFNTVDTFNKNTTTTLTQTKDGKTISLNSDTPMSQIEFDLQNEIQWSQSPFVSDGNFNKSNSGEQKTINSGNDSNNKTGTDINEKRGNDNTVTEINVINEDIFDGTEKIDFDGLEKTKTNTKYNNYDMIETYKKIFSTIKNIDNMICDELRVLFLEIY